MALYARGTYTLVDNSQNLLQIKTQRMMQERNGCISTGNSLLQIGHGIDKC